MSHGTPRAHRHCPPWCQVAHGVLAGEDDLVHVGATSVVAGIAVRLCAGVEPGGAPDGPYVLVGDQEYSLDAAAELAAVVALLVDQTRPAVPGLRGEPAAGCASPASPTGVTPPAAHPAEA